MYIVPLAHKLGYLRENNYLGVTMCVAMVSLGSLEGYSVDKADEDIKLKTSDVSIQNRVQKSCPKIPFFILSNPPIWPILDVFASN